MNESHPFYSNSLEAAGAGIYHTHPRCRIGQGIVPAMRMPGTGEGRQECPFCCILGQFQANWGLREQEPPAPGAEQLPKAENSTMAATVK